MYGPIGLGGIFGGIAGGVIVDVLVTSVGPVDMLLVCVALVLLGGGLGWLTETMLRPAPRMLTPASTTRDTPTRRAGALDGAREMLRSRYLLASSPWSSPTSSRRP